MSDTNDPAASSASPGWYPDGVGGQRYWDGVQWTEHSAPPAPGSMVPAPPYALAQPVLPMTPADEKQSATLAHALGIFTWIGPLVIFLTQGNRSVFVKHHATEALNFAITLFIGLMICFVLMFVLIGFLLFPIVLIGGWVFHILAAMAANRGEWYRYPISIRIISGAQG